MMVDGVNNAIELWTLSEFDLRVPRGRNITIRYRRRFAEPFPV